MARWRKLREWSRLFTEYAAAQFFTQLLGALAGLWLVNLLPIREYALYTLALSIFTFLAIVSDLGVSSALLYFRRETRKAQTAFAPYVSAAYRIRYILLGFGGCGGLFFLATIAPNRGFLFGEIAAIGAILLVAIWVQIGNSISILLLRLEGKYRESYLAELLGNSVRLAGVAALWLFSMALAWSAMLVGVAGSLFSRLLASRYLAGGDSLSGRNESAAKREHYRGLVQFILPTTMSTLYFAIQGPLTIWLSAFFAGTDSIAEVGALGRLGVIFGLLSGFTGAVLVPRLSAVTDDTLYLRRYLQCWGILALFGIAVIGIVWAVPHWFLYLLGPAYSKLSEGVLIVAVISVLSTWTGYMVAVNSARGWVRCQVASLSSFVAAQILLVALLDLSTTIGVLEFGLLCSVVSLTIVATINALGFIRPSVVEIQRPRVRREESVNP